MQNNIEFVNPNRLGFSEEGNEQLDVLIGKIINTYKELNINPKDKNIMYIRNKKGAGILGIQVGNANELSDYLLYRYETSKNNNDIVINMEKHVGKKVTKEIENAFDGKIYNYVVGCCKSLERKYSKDNPKYECAFLKRIKNKKHILQRLFGKD